MRVKYPFALFTGIAIFVFSISMAFHTGNDAKNNYFSTEFLETMAFCFVGLITIGFSVEAKGK